MMYMITPALQQSEGNLSICSAHYLDGRPRKHTQHSQGACYPGPGYLQAAGTIRYRTRSTSLGKSSALRGQNLRLVSVGKGLEHEAKCFQAMGWMRRQNIQKYVQSRIGKRLPLRSAKRMHQASRKVEGDIEDAPRCAMCRP